MKKAVLSIGFVGACVFFGSCAGSMGTGCLTGAFWTDRPTVASIEKFAADYGKRPAIVMVFLDWGKYPDGAVVRDVYDSGSALMITWEPWRAVQKAAIDYDAVLVGKEDAYLREFALSLKAIDKPVFLRFAQEMNGDWYPWAGAHIGPEKYRKLFQYIREIFDRAGVKNIRWVFSMNVENVPAKNDYVSCYPGSRFVDYIGLDGYNWGTTKSWSRWRSFNDLFSGIYAEVVRQYGKPVIISEFGTTSRGGDKARWIDEALKEVKRMPAVKALVLFNIDKETDWRIIPGSNAGQALRSGWENPYFRDAPSGDLK